MLLLLQTWSWLETDTKGTFVSTSLHFVSRIKADLTIRTDGEVRFVLDQHAYLDFYSASSLKQQSVSRQQSTWTHYPDSELISLWSFSLMQY